MGLDLVVEGCPRPGHEEEWRRILARSFDGEESAEQDQPRFAEISIPPYERIGAPRVGVDKAADDWIVQASKANTPEQVAEVLNEFRGYYVLRLVKCDGIPEYSNGGAYEGVDETSFRGAFLSDCTDVLEPGTIEAAWTHRFPEDAIEYGRTLLAAASSPTVPPRQESKPGFLARLTGAKEQPSPVPLEEQVRIVESAGRWFVFWGERGHAIRAWF